MRVTYVSNDLFKFELLFNHSDNYISEIKIFEIKKKFFEIACRSHRHLREIDCSLAIVGRPAGGAESGGKSINWSHMWRQKELHRGCCGW